MWSCLKKWVFLQKWEMKSRHLTSSCCHHLLKQLIVLLFFGRTEIHNTQKSVRFSEHSIHTVVPQSFRTMHQDIDPKQTTKHFFHGQTAIMCFPQNEQEVQMAAVASTRKSAVKQQLSKSTVKFSPPLLTF